jgi:hypothetical protein
VAVVLGKASERSQEAAKATTGEVLPEGRPGKETSKTGTLAGRSQSAGVSKETQRKLDALARRAPALLDEVRRGKKSTHRACVEAGIVKVPTPPQLAAKLLPKLPPPERLALLRALWSALEPDQQDAFIAELRTTGFLKPEAAWGQNKC